MDTPQVTRISACRSCGTPHPATFFDLGLHPLANRLLDDPGEPEPRFPLELSWCHACALVQLNHTVDPETLFSHYVWVTGTAAATRAYAERFSVLVAPALPPPGPGRYVLEVASNDGTFLRPFQRLGYSVLGVDPAANIARLAERDGVPTRVGFFGQALAEDLVRERGPATLVFARNVLPHVADTNDFVRGLCTALAPGGVLVLEVHDGRTIAEGLHYDSIYHEHLCYFTLRSLAALLERHGLEPVHVEASPISGGSLVVTVCRRGTKAVTAALTGQLERDRVDGVNDRAAWSTFAMRSREHGLALRACLEAERAAGRTVAAYGASARSATLVGSAGIGQLLTRIADQNPLKHGKYSPGAHLPICSPAEMIGSGPASVLVLAWNFYDEIADVLRGPLSFRGRIIRPLPAIEVEG